MNFSHLPLEGGLYDQHPQLIEEWSMILQIKGQEEKKRHKQQMQNMKSKRR